VAATNFEKPLDCAAWRRFGRALRLGMPDNKERALLLSLRLRQFQGSDNIIAEFLADMKGFSRCDVESAAIAAAKERVLDGRRLYAKKDAARAVAQQKELAALRKAQRQELG
jgi:AAA+ superfamily predicted ATPase